MGHLTFYCILPKLVNGPLIWVSMVGDSLIKIERVSNENEMLISKGWFYVMAKKKKKKTYRYGSHLSSYCISSLPQLVACFNKTSTY